MSIPKILHQVWLGENPIPEVFITWRNNWRQLHPDWEYRLWTEENTDIAEIKDMINVAQRFSSKSNIIRLYAVMKFGGVYCDFDFNWNKNIDELLVHKAFAAKERPDLYCNAMFGAEKEHEWVIYQFENLHKYCNQPPPWGPTLMTVAAKRFNSLTTLPTSFFYPYSWDKPFCSSKNFPESYVVHHWCQSWRDIRNTGMD